MRRQKRGRLRCGERRLRSFALGAVVALSLIGCAGSQGTTDTVPMCPRPEAAEAEGFERILEYEAIGDKRLSAFIAYFEELQHYCNEVLVAWRG